MKKLFITIILCGVGMALNAQRMTSPNENLSVKVTDEKLVITYKKHQVLELADITFSKLNFVREVKADYQMLAGKRLHCTNEANEYQASVGKDARMVMRLYNDGIAFRYEYSNLQNQKPPQENTVYLIPEGTRRWMMQWAESYEGFFPLSTTYKQKPVPSFSGTFASSDGWNNRWAYPALLEPTDGVFALISEANIERQQSASSLYNDGERFCVVPADNELELSGEWHTPWRIVIIGSLAEIVQSTLVTDVSEPGKLADINWIKPGVVSWIYWANNHGSNDYNIIKKYVDMAVSLHLPYVLIDAEWDEMDKLASNEGKTIEDAVAYALSKGIKPLIWYNSSVGWINGAPGPKFRLNKPEDREKEFAWCEKIGVAGVKIDFFSGDNQKNMDYCLDLMESAARYHLLVNFHGAPIPRGWQRTYPNLLSTEGVYGAEWYNNVATFTDKAACHNATLPFTRNVIGPMDYTPCAFSDSQHPHITTNAHELALTILYESGLQHLADRPESFLSQPQEVQDFLGQLPAIWDETRFISGYPGESVVLARRSGNTWYVAGINGKDEPQTLSLPLEALPKGNALMFADDAFGKWQISTISELPSQIDCQPRGGFVLVIRPTAQAEGAKVFMKPQQFHKALPAGNYSGITALGNNRYAVVSDKSEEDGFFVLHIEIDSIKGCISLLENEGFRSCGLPGRDLEGICYHPFTNTVFISGEQDNEVYEYALDGQRTGRRLDMPVKFKEANSNYGLESLTYDARRHLFYTTTERPLKGDSLLRIQSFDDDLKPGCFYYYRPDKPISRKYFQGVSGLCALNNGRLLILERQIRVPRLKFGASTIIRIYEITPSVEIFPDKRLLKEFRTRLTLIGRKFANYEGFCQPATNLLLLVADSQNRYKGFLRDWFLLIGM